MAKSPGISGLGVAMLTAGMVVAYAGVKGVSPLEVLRTTLAGNAPGSLQSTIPSLANTPSPVGRAGAEGAGGQVGGGGKSSALVQAARSQVGKPYVWGATGPDTFDCSGLVVYCLRSIGVQTPRFTTATFGTWAKGAGALRVPRDQIMFGDVIVRTGHMGIAVSNAAMIHAPHAGSQVKESPITAPQGSWTGWRLWPGPGSGASYWRGV